jgi:uncharacterized PurR-regulated membrane protein YhhQ (DUF165 family)
MSNPPNHTVPRTPRLAAVAAYAGAIVGANYLTTRYGLVPVGFGLTATAGTYSAGVALMLRNVVQDAYGRRLVLAAIVAGALLSALTAPSLALASGVAFGVSELADTTLYTPLRRCGWARAVAVASLLGAIVDSLVFLSVAGFPLTPRSLAGQLLAKQAAVWASLLGAGAWKRWGRAVPRHALKPASS